MTLYRNTGAHFKRETGVWIGRDVVFEPTVAELAQYGYKLREVSEDDAATRTPPKKEWPMVWPLKMDPALYLKLNPGGVHAKLARRLLRRTV